MDQQSHGRTTGQDTNSASNPAESGAASPGGKAAAGNGSAADGAQQAVLGPFTVRDLAVFAATLILFTASLLPLFGGRYNLWNLNNQFFLGLGVVLPLVVSALFAARRLAPQTKIRIGSLSIDQFASVTASFAVAFFFLATAAAFGPSLLVGLIGAVILFAATVLGRFLPFISADFQGRAEVPAHVVAREAAVPVRKPRAPKPPKPSEPVGDAARKSPLGGRLLAGGNAGSSAVRPGSAGTAVPHAPAPHAAAPAQTAAAGAAATAAGTTPHAAAAPVSTAPEVSEWTAQGEQLPATQATAVVRPASAPVGEQTQPGDVVAPAAAPETAHDGGARQGAPATGRTAEPPAATAVHPQVRVEQQIGATVDPASRPEDSGEHPVPEAFWFAVAQHRTAVDPETGAPAFVIEPGGWVLALEDRGHEFLVQHTDGRLGVLRDLSNIERG
ncbi:hypothetical protein ACIQCN_12185 [Pseudarthrobacter sp. NPDC092424]|uniref:hypothetical protein n=1 Tax=Pseudarthrobacter sp. NPDC092424 TaxID=3364415 RepID=UPI00382702A8